MAARTFIHENETDGEITGAHLQMNEDGTFDHHEHHVRKHHHREHQHRHSHIRGNWRKEGEEHVFNVTHHKTTFSHPDDAFEGRVGAEHRRPAAHIESGPAVQSLHFNLPMTAAPAGTPPPPKCPTVFPVAAVPH